MKRRAIFVRPAFSGATDNRIWLLAILTLFFLPWLTPYLGKPIFHKSYSSDINYGFFYDQIYREKTPIDLLIMGPCTAWWHIDTDLLKTRLSQQLDRHVNVLNFGFNHDGPGISLLLLRELLKYREVKNVVLATPRGVDKDPLHPETISFKWKPSDLFRDHENWKTSVTVYSAMMFGSLAALRASIFPPPFLRPEGAGETNHFSKKTADHQELASVIGKERLLLDRFDSTRVRISVELGSEKLPLYDRIREVIRANGGRLYLLSSPLTKDLPGDQFVERANWWQRWPDTTMIGVSESDLKLAAGSDSLSDYFSGGNFSSAGARLYSLALLPAFLQIVGEDQ